MAENSKIEWTDHTFNPWIGCTEMSPACDNCYARVLASRYGWAEWGAGKPRHRTSASNWKKAAAWERAAIKAGTRPSVFCASLADWADAEIPEGWRSDLEREIDGTPHLEWLLLTKRHNVAGKWAQARAPKQNARIGFTIENEEWARVRMPYLGRIALKGWKTFVSYEPALGPVNWDLYLDRDGLFGGTVGWLICGGESAQGVHREMRLEWAYAAKTACERNGVPFFMKQIDKKQPIPDDLMIREFPKAA